MELTACGIPIQEDIVLQKHFCSDVNSHAHVGPDYEQELLLLSIQSLQMLLCISAMTVSFR